MTMPFDKTARVYDAWYDTAEGKIILDAEVKCFRTLCPVYQGRWVEIGVGTGRFARSLGISEGLDPSEPMLKIASSRGVRTYWGYAESLPFDENSLDGILMALALCFVDSPEKTLEQCLLVLRPCGKLLIGFIPADSAWGKMYQLKKTQGHPIYSYANFLKTDQLLTMVEKYDFEFQQAACTLSWPPETLPPISPSVEQGVSPEAGFVCLLLASRKTC